MNQQSSSLLPSLICRRSSGRATTNSSQLTMLSSSTSNFSSSSWPRSSVMPRLSPLMSRSKNCASWRNGLVSGQVAPSRVFSDTKCRVRQDWPWPALPHRVWTRLSSCSSELVRSTHLIGAQGAGSIRVGILKHLVDIFFDARGHACFLLFGCRRKVFEVLCRRLVL